jgi:ATP-dependent DNA helicase RecG
MKRALEAWPEIDFIDDREGCLFTATVHRKIIEGAGIGSVNADGSPKSAVKGSEIGSEKNSEKILIIATAHQELVRRRKASRKTASTRLAEEARQESLADDAELKRYLEGKK